MISYILQNVILIILAFFAMVFLAILYAVKRGGS
jgi:hypothetical protein